ncbi:MAG: hypothetical protein IKA17_01880 [Clostridia bacterium]|nr:hypothetical protein [Clostridia bacterium]
MRCELIKKNKGIVISAIILVLLSISFTAAINFKFFYSGNISELVASFIRGILRLAISTGAFALAYKYGRGFVLKYGWVFIPVGILISALYEGGGYINVFNYSIELASLTNTLAFVGFATYFYKYCTKSIIHTLIFWISGFIFLIALEQNYLTLILFVMVGLMLISARKNKLISKKSVQIFNIVLYVVLILRTINITLMGITELTNLFYDSSYMAFVARFTYTGTKWFGAAVEPFLIGGDVAYYKLLWIFGLFGVVAGVVAFVALAAFIFFVCRKCFKNVLTDATPIAYATASILLVRFIVSMLTNFGIVLDGLFAPIPILSDATCGYIAIFVLLGLIIGKEKVDIHSKRFGFAGRLSNFTEREFVFDGVECRSIEGVLQSFKCKDTTEQKRICMLSGIDAKNAGADFDWKTEQVLHWNGAEYPRESVEYEELLKRLYQSVYACDSSFKKDIEDSKEYILDHSIGVEDKAETVLTKEEFISNLTMLQGRA